MTTGNDKQRSGSPKVQTFEMPKPPPPPPPEEVKPAKASASHWVVLFFLAVTCGLLAFYWLHWAPKMEAEQARILAEEAFIRPWPERAEEAVRTTFEGESGHALAASLQAVISPDATDAKLLGIDITQTEKNLVTVFSVGWAEPVPEGEPAAEGDEPAQPTITTAKFQWKSANKKHISAEYVVPEGGTALPEDQNKGIQKVFTTSVHPVVRRNIAEK